MYFRFLYVPNWNWNRRVWSNAFLIVDACNTIDQSTRTFRLNCVVLPFRFGRCSQMKTSQRFTGMQPTIAWLREAPDFGYTICTQAKEWWHPNLVIPRPMNQRHATFGLRIWEPNSWTRPLWRSRTKTTNMIPLKIWSYWIKTNEMATK